MKNTINIRDYKNFLRAPLTQRFINCLMVKGKKTKAEKILFDSFQLIKELNKNPFKIFDRAIKNISPNIEIRSMRIRRKKKKIPMPITGRRQSFFGIKWIIKSARTNEKKQKNFIKISLMKQLILASNKEGTSFQKKIELHKSVHDNRTDAFLRWF